MSFSETLKKGSEKLGDISASISVLTDFNDTLLAFDAQFAQAQKDDNDIIEGLLQRGKGLKADAEIHLDAVKEVRRKLSLWVKAMA